MRREERGAPGSNNNIGVDGSTEVKIASAEAAEAEKALREILRYCALLDNEPIKRDFVARVLSEIRAEPSGSRSEAGRGLLTLPNLRSLALELGGPLLWTTQAAAEAKPLPTVTGAAEQNQSRPD